MSSLATAPKAKLGIFTGYGRHLFQSRYILMQMAKRDFKSRYVGSSLGLIWAFLQPLAMMLILWFVFSYGLKAKHVSGDIPFVAWFFTAMVAWNFFADVLLVNTNVLGEYSFMIRKVEFKLGILPLVKILSSLGIHLIFLLILFAILLINGVEPSWHWLQLPYYLFATIYLLLGMSWLTAALNVFLKDTFQFVSILVQFGFWVTPIIWNMNMLSPEMQRFLKLNPVLYITEGYRACLLYRTPLWEAGVNSTIYFWLFSTSLFVLGIFVFRKLRPHFADVL